MSKSIRHTYTKEQIRFIEINYPDFGADYCGKILGINPTKITKAANARQIKVKEKTISDIHKQDTRSRFLERFKKEYDIFFNFNDLQSIYLFGFLWADGYLGIKEKRLHLGIQEKDGLELKEIIEKKLSCSHKILKRSRYQKQTSNIIQFRKNNFLITDKLIELDFHKKSFIAPTKILDLIPKDFHYMFWRGFFDGDGCAYSNKEKCSNVISISSTFDYDWKEFIIFCNQKNITFKIRKINNLKSKSSSFLITKISNIINFFNEIYPNKIYDKIGLKRKFEIMEGIKYLNKEDYIIKKPKFNIKTKSFCVYQNKKSFFAVIKSDNQIYRFHNKDINKCREFADKINTQLGRLEYLNSKIIRFS